LSGVKPIGLSAEKSVGGIKVENPAKGGGEGGKIERTVFASINGNE